MLGIEDLASRLEAATNKGTYWVARCPAHDDRGQSLTIRQLRDRGVSLSCSAGCEACSVLGALGLPGAQLEPPRRDSAANDGPPSSPGSREACLELWGVPSRGWWHIPFEVVTACVPSSGQTMMRRYIRFEYPADGLEHWVSIRPLVLAPRTARRRHNVWLPDGKARSSLFHYVAPQIEPHDWHTLYLVEGERDQIALAQLGYFAFALPRNSALSDANVKWLEVQMGGIDRIRVYFGPPATARQSAAANALRRAYPGLEIEQLFWSEDARPGFGLCDVLREDRHAIEGL